MATPVLVETDMENGKGAAAVFMKDQVLRPSAVLWLYDTEAEEWRFIIATEDARIRGPQAAYLRVRNVLKNAGLLEKIPLRRVVVTDPSHPLLATVRSVVIVPADELGGASFYDCVFNGVTVPGMHIYVLNDGSSQATPVVGKNVEAEADTKR